MHELAVGLLQMKVSVNREENLLRAEEMARDAARKGAKLVVLPEMFLCPYDTACFAQYAEAEGGKAYRMLSRVAKETGVLLVGGSMPEIDEQSRLYNTSYVFDPQGQCIAKHRKVHLFNIDIPGGQRFRESDVLTAGDKATVFNTPFGRMGVAICFDIRFPELARTAALLGAKMMIYPGAFNPTTGPAHWSLLHRARALDNQFFSVGVAPACDPDASYHSYGHSLIADPWGTLLCELDDKETLSVIKVDLDAVEKIRTSLPVLRARKPHTYGE